MADTIVQGVRIKSLAVVICNYNKKAFVMNNIASVFDSNYKDFDLIVVDNASTDGSAEAIREQYCDKLTLLVNEENTGGSGGFNRGMQYALDKGYDYIHCLDDDVVLDKEAIGALRGFMETHTDVGVCGSLVCRMGMKGHIQELGAMIDLENLGVTPLYGGRRVDDDLPDSVECDYVAACSAMFRAEVLKKTGVIDREFFIYWDDMSLCLEIRLAGYKVCACSKSVVWHNGNYGGRTAFSRYYSLRNKIHCFAKNLQEMEFVRLADILTNMMFRIFAVNRNKPEQINNYFFALDDALNGIRGKADDYKTANYDNANDKFRNVFLHKNRVLILYDEVVPEIDRIVQKLRETTNLKISIFAEKGNAPVVEGVAYVDNPNGDYDVAIQLCYHILDVEEYDRNKVYIDKYTNEILDDADFDFYENYEYNREFFNSMFSGFIRKKLCALREKLRESL
jgi:GT2 family glycosyltransferase